MSVTVDQRPLPVEELGLNTVGEVLTHLQKSGGGRLVVHVLIDGQEPDLVLEMPLEYQIPAEGELSVQNFYTKVPFDTDRFAQVVELRPGNRGVVHHAGIYFVDLPEGATIDKDGRMILPEGRRGGARNAEFGLPGSSKLLSFVPGRGVDQHREDVGKRIPATELAQLRAGA